MATITQDVTTYRALSALVRNPAKSEERRVAADSRRHEINRSLPLRLATGLRHEAIALDMLYDRKRRRLDVTYATGKVARLHRIVSELTRFAEDWSAAFEHAGLRGSGHLETSLWPVNTSTWTDVVELSGRRCRVVGQEFAVDVVQDHKRDDVYFVHRTGYEQPRQVVQGKAAAVKFARQWVANAVELVRAWERTAREVAPARLRIQPTRGWADVLDVGDVVVGRISTPTIEMDPADQQFTAAALVDDNLIVHTSHRFARAENAVNWVLRTASPRPAVLASS